MTAMVSPDERGAALPSDGALSRLQDAHSSRRATTATGFADVAQRFSAAFASLKACATQDPETAVTVCAQ